MELIKCPRCFDEVQGNAYGIHVSETCIAIGKSSEEIRAIQEANSKPYSVLDTLVGET